MPKDQVQMFGGDWTEKKLNLLGEYLKSYTTALKNKSFSLTYIDAFAGTGYREVPTKESDTYLLFDGPDLEKAIEFHDGSVKKALQTNPSFHDYIFIEMDPTRHYELLKVKNDFPEKAGRIKIVSEDCNIFLQSFCKKENWSNQRAVAFLDPNGMQVDWSTMEAIADTKAIDVWVLFPLGMAVNRLLRRDGRIPESWKKRLNRIFGTEEWYDYFYKPKEKKDMFGQEIVIEKTANIDKIAEFYCKRLKEIFPGVANNPKILLNAKGSPLFLFCFAMSNPSSKARELALRLAEHLLGK